MSGVWRAFNLPSAMSEPSAATPETLEVKRRGRHRLIGAVTLAVLAVVIIPMVLDSEPRRVSKDLALTIPPKEGLPPLPPPTPEPKAGTDVAKPAPVEPAKPADVPTNAVDAKPEEKKSEDGKAPEKAAKETKPAKVAEKPAEKADKLGAKMEGFAIQLGAFSDAEKLSALKAKMKAAKVPVFTENVKTANGSLTRLRAGPYKTREQADKALASVKKAGADGQVVPLP